MKKTPIEIRGQPELDNVLYYYTKGLYCFDIIKNNIILETYSTNSKDEFLEIIKHLKELNKNV